MVNRTALPFTRMAPYRRHGVARTMLEQDNVYLTGHGGESTAALSKQGDARVASLALAVDPGALNREHRA